jgi:2-amino-4-hydroxy-6-hydroxymethyldihydropteridine diphosphokinase
MQISALDAIVVIALGSNLRGRFPSTHALLDAALERFGEADLNVRKSSRWWRSTSWPDRTLPVYLNGVALVDTDLDPRGVMTRLRAIEHAFGRERDEPNAPRTLDLDLIAQGRLRVREADLIVPHPRAHERLFVMGPLAELAPDWIHPVLGLSAAELAVAARVGRDAEPLAAA